MTTPTTTHANNSSITTTISPSGAPSSLPYPRDYFFPPFFTRQPIPSTHHAQRSKWASWILSYARHHRLWKLSLVDALDTELFYNRKIDRRLSMADAREVLEWMRGTGRIEWIAGGTGAGAGGGGPGEEDGRGVCWVWWRTPEEWGAAIAEWVEETGQKNTVLTLYELTESTATSSQEFHGMDPEVLQKALNVLVKRGKAQVFGEEDQRGVKFF